MEIVELTDRLHLVRARFGQVYLWQDGSRITMVDTGVVGSGDDLAEAFAELGYRRTDLARVVITHAHKDHAGAISGVLGWADAEVVAHRLDAPVIRGEKTQDPPVITKAEEPIFARFGTGHPPIPPSRVDTEAGDGATLDVGGGATLIGTPGHTAGSMAVWIPGAAVLLTGDIIANAERGVMLGPFNTDRELARRSAARLATLPAAIVGFGHGDPLHGEAGHRAWADFATSCRTAVPDPLGD